MARNLTLKISLCGLFSALATIAFTLESLFPPIILPGARMGVSNVFILLAVLSLGAGYGFICLVIKIFLGSLFSGNLSSMMYSLPAGIVSLGVEILILYLVKKVSLPAVSIAGAVINSTVQNVVFCLITGVTEYLYYLPYLALIAIFSGFIVGLTVHLVNNRLQNRLKN